MDASHPRLEFAKPILHLLCAGFEICVLALAIHVVFFRFPRLQKVIQYSILGINIVVFAVDAFLLVGWHSVFNQGMAEIVLSIDPYVVKDFIFLYVFSFSTVAIIFGIAAAFFFACRLNASGISVDRRKKAVSFLALFLCFALGFAAMQGRRILLRAPLAEIDIPFVRAVNSFKMGIRALGSYEQVNHKLKESAEKEELLQDKSDIPYVIFVLGESTDRNKMSLYGYSLQTNPLLERRMEAGELVVFDDTIACANFTTAAMQLIFSFAEKEHKEPWYEYPDLISILKKAGYHTIWLSNQVRSGGVGNMDQVLSEICDTSAFTFIGDGTESYPKDGKLLALLDESLKKEEIGKCFYTVHLMGTHEPFYYKYPKAFDKFTAADEEGGPEKWRKVKAQYDNAVLYNDYVMDEIIRRFTDKEAVVIYISDHGEEVYDGRDFFGHSREDVGNRHMIEVPFIVWGSAEFRKKRPAMWDNITKASHKPFRTDNLIHVILDLMSIQSSSYDTAESVINTSYNANIERIYNKRPYKKES